MHLLFLIHRWRLVYNLDIFLLFSGIYLGILRSVFFLCNFGWGLDLFFESLYSREVFWKPMFHGFLFASWLIHSILSPKVLMAFSFCWKRFLHLGLKVFLCAGLVGSAFSFMQYFKATLLHLSFGGVPYGSAYRLLVGLLGFMAYQPL